MDTSLVPTPQLPPTPPDVVVALSPEELPAAQAHLATWCDQQIATFDAELKDLDEHCMIAATHGWKLASIENAMRRAAQRRTYYRKVKAALDAGYLIVPNMPVDLLAIRVKRDGPTWMDRKGQETGWRPARFDMPADVLPEGEGHYVDEGVPPVDASYYADDGKGGRRKVAKWIPGSEYVEPDFPVRAVKPVVLEATQRAMALKIFDEIGTVQQDANARGRDPIMVGRIRDTKHRTAKVATFFLAWWLNPADL